MILNMILGQYLQTRVLNITTHQILFIFRHDSSKTQLRTWAETVFNSSKIFERTIVTKLQFSCF